jgi:uncharacterized protein YabN with tetrapyrrole methylase and pyrophosphatase domain
MKAKKRRAIDEGLPAGLPALHRAHRLQDRAAGVGFDWPDAAGPLAKLREEVDELEAEVRRAGEPAPETEPDGRVASEVGDLLFSAVNLARRLNVDPELALRATSETFVARVERAVELAAERGEDWAGMALTEQDRYYERAKGQR